MIVPIIGTITETIVSVKADLTCGVITETWKTNEPQNQRTKKPLAASILRSTSLLSAVIASGYTPGQNQFSSLNSGSSDDDDDDRV